MKVFTKSMEPNATLGVAERTAYMVGNAGTALINTIIATFLMYYYTDVMFLNPGIIGIILLASRVFDGVTDIFMGMIVDRTHSKHGKGRVWLIRTCLPFAISGFLLVCVPGGATDIVKYVYVFFTYNLCNAILLTALYVPYNTMTYALTSNPYERGILGIFVLFGATAGTLMVQSTVDSATKALGGDQRAWQIVIGIYALMGFIMHLVCFFGTKERVVEEGAKGKLSVKAELGALFGNKYWVLAIVTTLVIMFFTAFTGSAGIYYAKGVLGDTAYYAQFANFFSITQIISLLICFIPMKKLGKRNTLLTGLVILLTGMLIQCFGGETLTVLIAASCFKGIGGGFVAGVAYGLVADTIDYGLWKTNVRAEGVGMAALTFVTKISAGLSGAIIGWVNDSFGYNASETIQNSMSVFGLKLCFSYLPLFCVIVGAVLMMFYDLDKKFPQIQKELQERANQQRGLS